MSKFKLTLTIVAVVLMASPAIAATITTVLQAAGSGNFPVSSTDLLDQSGTAYSSIENYPQDPQGIFDGTNMAGGNDQGDATQLNDGVFGAFNVTDEGYRPYPAGFGGPSETYWFFDTGYDLESVVMTSGYEANRNKQAWTMWTSSNGGASYSLLASVDGTEANNGTYPLGIGCEVQITLTDTTGTLASGVDAIKVRWEDPRIGSPGYGGDQSTVYRELDVFKVPGSNDLTAIASTDWQLPATWAGAPPAIPTDGTNVTVENFSVGVTTSNAVGGALSVLSAGVVTVTPGAVLTLKTVQGDGTIALQNTAKLTIDGGSIDNVSIAGTSTIEASGSLTIGNLSDGGAAAVFVTQGGGTISLGTVTAQAGTVLQLSGGTLDLQGGSRSGGPSPGPGLSGEYYDFNPPQNGGGLDNNSWNGIDSIANLDAFRASHNPDVASVLLQEIDFPVGGGNDSTNGNPFGAIANVGNDQIVAIWEGSLVVPATGDYNFFTASDDGSVLFIDGVKVVNNNQFQFVTERVGTVNGLTAGPHDLLVAYYEGGSGAGMAAQWESAGAGISKQMIPASAFERFGALVADYSTVNARVTADSTLNSTYGVDVGTLTIDPGATLTTSGGNISFASTTISGVGDATVGITTNTDTTLTRVSGLALGDRNVTVNIAGSGRAIVDKAGTGLANTRFNLQSGELVGLIDGGHTFGAANFDFNGGTLALLSAGGAQALDLPLAAPGGGTLAVGEDPAGTGSTVLTYGSAANGVTLDNYASMAFQGRDGATINVVGAVSDADGGVGGGLAATGGTVNVNDLGGANGRKTYSGATAASGGATMNINTPITTTSNVDVSGGATMVLNANVTTNGGIAWVTGLRGSIFTNTADNETPVNLDGANYVMGVSRVFTGGKANTILIDGREDPNNNVLVTGAAQNFNAFPNFNGGDHFVAAFSGRFFPQANGSYNFHWDSDDRGLMFIDMNDDGTFDNSERVAGYARNANGNRDLSAGQGYNVIYMAQEFGGGESVNWYFAPPDGSERRVDVSDPNQAGLWKTLDAVPSITTVNGGTLEISDNVTLTTPEVSLSGGGTVDVKPLGTLATGKVTMDSGTLTVPHDLNLTELNYSGGILNLGGDLAVSDNLTVGGPLDMSGKTLTTTLGVTKVDVLAAGALTVDDPVLGSDLSVAGSLTTPSFAFSSATVSGTLNTTDDATTNVLDITRHAQINTNGSRIIVSDSLKAGNLTATTIVGTVAMINPVLGSGIDTIELGGTVAIERPPAVPTEGLQLWLDASTLGLDDGDSVTRWDDQSGGGNHADNVGRGDPKYVAVGPNGNPAVAFTDDQLFTTHNFDDLNGYTILTVARYTGGDSERVISSQDHNWLFGFWGQHDEAWYAEGWINNNNTGDANTDWHLHVGTMTDEADSLATFWKDGVQLASNRDFDDTNNKPGRLSLGGWNTSEFSNAEIAEVIIYDGVLTSDQLDGLGGYLSNKYGLNTPYPPAPPPGEGAILNNVIGNGTIIGDVVITGDVGPGVDSVGRITVQGNLDMAAGSSYTFEVNLDGEDNLISDLIDVNGMLTLPSGETPKDVITINISDISPAGVGTIPGGELTLFTFDQFGNEPPRIADLVPDGIIDDKDLNVLLSAFGEVGEGLPADLIPDGVIDQLDLDRLLEDFGSDFSSGPLGDIIVIGDVPANWLSAGTPAFDGTRVFLSGVNTGAGLNAVPEPGTIVLLLLGVLGVVPMLRRCMKGLSWSRDL